MVRLSIVFAVLAVFGCASTSDGSNRYTRAANSWKGGNIMDMVAAWGTPNAGYLPADGEISGVAGWDVRYKSGTGEGKVTYYHCTTFAYFNSNDAIVRIVVKNSRYCHRRYGDDIQSMTRNSGIRT